MQITSPPAPSFHPEISTLHSVAHRRQRVALTLTVLMLGAYFSFILSIAYFKDVLSAQVVPGLTGAILAGVAAVTFALSLTIGYVVWVNKVHDRAVLELRKRNH